MKKNNIAFIYLIFLCFTHYVQTIEKLKDYDKFLKKYARKIDEDLNFHINLSALFLTG